MNVSEDGIRLIKSFEGYGRKLANGDCTAYQTKLKSGKLDVPTIGYGCTEGVSMGMVWTSAQAEAALEKEIAKHQAAVTQLVTVEINQNENDACASLSYNIGTGIGSKTRGFANSSVLKKLNAGDRAGAAKAFALYNKAQGVVEPALVARRTREAALFLKPVAEPVEPFMPQTVQKSAEPVSKKTVAATVAGATAAASQAMPSVSDVDKMVQTGQHVRSLTDQIGDLSSWMWHSQFAPVAFALMAVGVIYVWLEGGIGTSSSKGTASDSSA